MALILPLHPREQREAETPPLSPSPRPAPSRRPAENRAPAKSLPLVWSRDMRPRLHAGGTLVKGLLDTGAMSVIYAPSNVGKSFFALDLAFHIATGSDWRGRKIVQPGCVLYLAAEGGAGFVNRVEAIKRHRNLPPDADIPLAVVPCPIDLLDPAADRDAVIKLAADAAKASGRPVVLVVIDTLSRAMSGGDESASKDMTAIIANVDAIRAAQGAHCMIVHHCGKDVARGARGHSSLRAATDTEIELARTGEGEDKSAVASVKKQRDMPGDEAFPFTLRGVLLGHDEDGDPVTSAVVEHLDQPDLADPSARRIKGMPALRLEKLHDTIARWGERVEAPDHIPTGEMVTTLDRWRQALADGGLIDGETADARRMQFNRTREALLKKRAIGIWSGYVWPVRPDEG